MRHALFLALTTLLACAGPITTSDIQASLAELKEKQQVDIENLRKKLDFVIGELRAEIETLKETNEALADKIEKAAAPSRPYRPSGPDREAVYAFPVGGSPIRGAKDAWVTIVEISDFQCPFCSRVQPTLSALQDKYGKDVRLVFKHNPLGFHQRAMPAAIAVECAHNQGLFWRMHDMLWDNQRALEDDQLAGYARQLGQLSFKTWKRCFDQNRPKKRVEDDQRTAMGLGARGTPAFFINGRFLSGAQPQAAFEAVIDEELKKAKKSGIVRRDYYEKAVVAKGKKEM